MESSSQVDVLKIREHMVPQFVEINTNSVTQIQIMHISDGAIEEVFFITQIGAVETYFC